MTLICPLLPVRVRKRGAGKPPWERVYGFLSPVFDTGDKMPDRGQNGDKLSSGLMYQGFQDFSVCPLLWFFLRGQSGMKP